MSQPHSETDGIIVIRIDRKQVLHTIKAVLFIGLVGFACVAIAVGAFYLSKMPNKNTDTWQASPSSTHGSTTRPTEVYGDSPQYQRVKPENDPVVIEAGNCVVNFLDSYDSGVSAIWNNAQWGKAAPYASSEYINNCKGIAPLDLVLCGIGGNRNPMSPTRVEGSRVIYADCRHAGNVVYVKLVTIETLTRQPHIVYFKYDVNRKLVVGHSPDDNGF